VPEGQDTGLGKPLLIWFGPVDLLAFGCGGHSTYRHADRVFAWNCCGR
jgi:hypothetical protein